ncbi:AraC family transcriptional regulator [uncultured Maricaulis sp.]|uniref:helix-turn-helix domain-containing protein n=1 Tax=uncultured Maricaulis sp. TaxID=174710 RepID=UPI002625E0D9|nr:AraC family transcriptional regulator [uncultured Maricaulis sp.]
MILALSITGASLSLFLLCFLASKRKRVLGDRWLGAWLVLHGIYFLALTGSQSLDGTGLLAATLIAQTMSVLFAPAQYLQVAEATHQTGAGPYRAAALTVACAAILLSGVLTLSPRFVNGAIAIDISQAWLMLLPPLAMLASFYFPVSALQRLQRFRRAAKTRLSNLESAGLGWIRIWIWSTVGMLVIQLAVFALSILTPLPIPLHVATLLAAQCLQISWAGYHGLRAEGVFHLDPLRSDETRLMDRRDLEAARADFGQLRALLADGQPHLDPNLTSSQLVDQIGWSPERLHRAIRSGGATSFHDLVNEARLDTLAMLIRDPVNSRVSLLGLAHDAGFGSKSGFYAVFKTLRTGSPAAWRRELTH